MTRFPDPETWLSPEARLIRDAAGASVLGCGEPIPPPDLDWNSVVDLAEGHGLIFAAGRLLADMRETPETVRAALRRRIRAATFRTMGMTAAAVRVWEALERAGIEAVMLKGCALSAQLYGDPLRRPARDVDPLVRPETRDAAIAALLPLGYRLTRPVPVWLDDGAEITLIGEGSTVDLHTRLAHADATCPVDTLRLFDDAVSVTIGGTVVRAPSPRVALVYLASHATRHHCRRLGWLLDFAVARRVWAEAWPEAVETAASIGAESRLRLVTLLAARLFGEPLPADWDGRRASIKAARLTRDLAPVLSAPPRDDGDALRLMGLWRSFRWDLRLSDGLGPRLSVIAARLRPRAEDVDGERRVPGVRLRYLARKLTRVVVKELIGRGPAGENGDKPKSR